jgi:DNA replication protein DnaC
MPLPGHFSVEIYNRLLHRAHVLNIKGRSYRLRDLEDALKA